jgi:hypothetical protein
LKDFGIVRRIILKWILWIGVALERVQWWELMITVLHLRVLQRENIVWLAKRLAASQEGPILHTVTQYVR